MDNFGGKFVIGADLRRDPRSAGIQDGYFEGAGGKLNEQMSE